MVEENGIIIKKNTFEIDVLQQQQQIITPAATNKTDDDNKNML